MNNLKQAFEELKVAVNEMAEDMGYKVRYYTGPIGEPLMIEVDGYRVRALRVQKNGHEIIVAKIPEKVYAFKDGLKYDITANFLYYKVSKYMAMEEGFKKKLRKQSPLLGSLEMVLNSLRKEGLDMDFIDIFVPDQAIPEHIKEIKLSFK